MKTIYAGVEAVPATKEEWLNTIKSSGMPYVFIMWAEIIAAGCEDDGVAVHFEPTTALKNYVNEAYSNDEDDEDFVGPKWDGIHFMTYASVENYLGGLGYIDSNGRGDSYWLQLMVPVE